MSIRIEPNTESRGEFERPSEIEDQVSPTFEEESEPTDTTESCEQEDGKECVVLGDKNINVNVSGLSEDLQSVNEIFTSDSVVDLTDEEKQELLTVLLQYNLQHLQEQLEFEEEIEELEEPAFAI